MKGLFLNPDIYVINLERAKARKAMLEQSVPAVLRPRLKFFRAVDAKDEAELDPWKKRVSKWRTYLSIRRELSDSEIACFASHYSLWKLIAEKRICGEEGAAVRDVIRDDARRDGTAREAMRYVRETHAPEVVFPRLEKIIREVIA